MSVVVKRRSAPLTQIVVTDGDGYALVLWRGPMEESRLRALVRPNGDDDYVVIHPSDARHLAAALVEWADSVEA